MVGIAIIGAGYWGKNHIRNYKTLLMEKEIEYLKIYDINLGRLKQMAMDYNIDYTENIDDIRNDKKINAVVIVTPSDSHYELTKMFLESDKDVFVEKPLTLDSNQAKELINISQENSKILMVGHLFRYHPAVKDIKRRIDIGEFGKINMILSYRFALGVPRKDMGVIFALAVHDLDLTCYFLNQSIPESIMVDNASFYQDRVVEMTNISLTFKDGAKGYMTESWNIPVYDRKRELIIIGSEKSALINYLNPNEYEIFDTKIKKIHIDNKLILEKEENTINKVILDYKEPLNEEILHFLQCIKKRKTPETNGVVGYNAVKMCEKAFLSAKENKRIYFK
ncbi:MAG: Gfo/Idh/MocA family protein [Promethearchaeota archaeon]